MPIQATRALLHAALSGRLEDVEYRTDTVFGFEVPVHVPGVDQALLDPRSTWRDPAAYDAKAASSPRCSTRTSRIRARRARRRGRRAGCLARSRRVQLGSTQWEARTTCS